MRDTMAFQSVAAFTIVVSLITGLMAVYPPRRVSEMTTISTQPCQKFGVKGCEMIPEGVAWR